MTQLVNPSFDKAIINYFSGTGNAKSVAYWVGEEVYKQGVQVQIKNIGVLNDVNIDDDLDINKNTLIGFTYPTHGFNAPPIVLKYLFHFPKSINNNKVFLINTRAGMKLSKLFIPGLSGLALLLPAIILLLKGYKIIGYRPIDLPSNWISLHPGLRKKVINSIFDRCRGITDKFSEKILSGKNVFTGLWWLPFDIALIPLSIGYFFYGRFMLSKTYIATNDCNECGLCADNCPVKAISMKNGKPFWSYKCESCMQCLNNCPTRAIQTPHGFIILFWWLCFSFLPVIIVNIISSFVNINIPFFKIAMPLFLLIFSIATLFGSYAILHKLMSITIINNIIKYTSFTYFKFWRRYKAPKI